MLKLTPQIVWTTGPEKMVVLPEAQFRMLEEAAAERLGMKPMGAPPNLPEPVRRQIDAGDSPIRVLRKWRGMTARELARIVDISPSMMSQIERTGKTGSTRTLSKIAVALGVPLQVIVRF